MMSKTFDNGMICASEQAVIVDKEIAKAFEDYMKANNCYFLNKEETEKLTKFMFPDPSKGVYGPLVGKSANWIAEQAGLKVPEKTKILIAPISSPDENHPLAKEKLSPVLAYFVVNSKQQGSDYTNKMLELGGLGHAFPDAGLRLLRQEQRVPERHDGEPHQQKAHRQEEGEHAVVQGAAPHLF